MRRLSGEPKPGLKLTYGHSRGGRPLRRRGRGGGRGTRPGRQCATSTNGRCRETHTLVCTELVVPIVVRADVVDEVGDAVPLRMTVKSSKTVSKMVATVGPAK